MELLSFADKTVVGTVLNGPAISAVVKAVGFMEALEGSSKVARGGHLCAK